MSARATRYQVEFWEPEARRWRAVQLEPGHAPLTFADRAEAEKAEATIAPLVPGATRIVEVTSR